MPTSILILMVLLSASLLITLAMHTATHITLRRRRASLGPVYRPPISILKPVKGVDDGLYENLAAMARQDYARFEMIIGAADENDPALDVARQIRRDFPNVSIRIVAGASTEGVNPKVQNLANMVRFARFDHVLISDSNVRPNEHYLRDMATELQRPNVGLVHSVLVGTHAGSLGGALENMQLNAFVVSAVCGASVFANRACVIGKSMLFRMSVLNRLGGFAGVQDVLAEDYVTGNLFEKNGYVVALCNKPLAVIAGRRSVADFMNRHLRWHQMRRWISPGTYAMEPLMNASLFAIALMVGGGITNTSLAIWLGLAGLALKLTADASLLLALEQPMPTPRTLVHMLLKDVMLVGLWTVGLVVRRVNWRGQEMRIGPNSVLAPMAMQRATLKPRMSEAA